MALDFKSGIKSANQRYKESGSSLPFKDWIEREKAKGIVLPQNGVTDVFEETKAKLESNEDKKPNNKIIGLDKRILMLSALIVVGAVAYKYLYKKE